MKVLNTFTFLFFISWYFICPYFEDQLLFIVCMSVWQKKIPDLLPCNSKWWLSGQSFCKHTQQHNTHCIQCKKTKKTNNPSIYFLLLLLLHLRLLELLPSVSGWRWGLLPEQVTCLSQGYIERQTIHTRIHYSQLRLPNRPHIHVFGQGEQANFTQKVLRSSS